MSVFYLSCAYTLSASQASNLPLQRLQADQKKEEAALVVSLKKEIGAFLDLLAKEFDCSDQMKAQKARLFWMSADSIKQDLDRKAVNAYPIDHFVKEFIGLLNDYYQLTPQDVATILKQVQTTTASSTSSQSSSSVSETSAPATTSTTATSVPSASRKPLKNALLHRIKVNHTCSIY